MFVTILKLYYWVVISMNRFSKCLCYNIESKKNNDDIESNDYSDDEDNDNMIVCNNMLHYCMIFCFIITDILVIYLIYDLYRS